MEQAEVYQGTIKFQDKRGIIRGKCLNGSGISYGLISRGISYELK